MKREITRRWGLTISLVLFVFAVMMAAMVLAGLLILLLSAAGLFPLTQGPPAQQQGAGGAWHVILVMMLSSILLGTTIAAFFSKKALKPIHRAIEAIHKIAEGDFSVRVGLKGIYELEELSQSFNKMAQELSAKEILSADFINDFSHEFKTPIVSIRGFAKLLQQGTVTEAEKQDYLRIIITESERLAQLSTNILNLSKYESTEIITDKTPFRLDEQIRRAVVMTEPKWSAKRINLSLEMEEIQFTGNEDMLEQIWLNLMDNAVKFAHESGTITIWLMKWNGAIRFAIRDDGIGMDEETQEKIFTKFFQGEPSRTGQGNGLGLTIVQRIVTLCGGELHVQSEVGKGSTFTVSLPDGKQ